MLAKDIKTGSILNYGDAPCMIESVTVQRLPPAGRRRSTSSARGT